MRSSVHHAAGLIWAPRPCALIIAAATLLICRACYNSRLRANCNVPANDCWLPKGIDMVGMLSWAATPRGVCNSRVTQEQCVYSHSSFTDLQGSSAHLHSRCQRQGRLGNWEWSAAGRSRHQHQIPTRLHSATAKVYSSLYTLCSAFVETQTPACNTQSMHDTHL